MLIKENESRALKVQSTSGEELLVRFTYERLPNYCYLFGCLSHIDKYCKVRFEESYRDIEETSSYVPWQGVLVPIWGRPQGEQNWSKTSSKSSSHQRPPACTSVAVFGNFGKAQGPCEPRLNSGVRSMGSPYGNPVGSKGSIGDEVDSSPPNTNHTAGSNSGGWAELEGENGGFVHGIIEKSSKGVGDGQLNLINILFRFMSEGLCSARRGAHRGRPPGRVHGVVHEREIEAFSLLKLTETQFMELSRECTCSDIDGIIELHGPSLVFLSKTKCKARRCDRIKSLVTYYGIGVDSIGKGGRLLLLWQKDVEVWLQSFSIHHIDVTVKFDDCPDRWRFIGFYGHRDVARRKEGWNLLRRLVQASVQPGCVHGTLARFWISTKSKGPFLELTGRLETFESVFRIAGFRILVFKVIYSLGAIVKKNQVPSDRVCSDSQWATLFPKATVVYQVAAF
ncbi:hypothetical protein Sango_2841200 [Sesamum angolense]|uniref:Zinc knuckle CX2CX4HX4C domain-containing protein n=1 Tax=Sesamum angolense TaxID=2727404 RepID=A0AAE1T766_9LAMI|nr:hypothetical protein Sango_2841200 [Sesamum angolense]